jgi:transposase
MDDFKTFLKEVFHIKDDVLITNIIINKEFRKLDIFLDFSPLAIFVCPICRKITFKIHDRKTKIWRQVNLANYKCYLHCDVPRVRCQQCGVHLINVPWAKKNSFLTYQFEKHIMNSARHSPVSVIAQENFIHDTQVWRVIKYYVNKLWKEQDWSEVTKTGIDETSSKKGHNYITIFVDMIRNNVIFATEGKGSETIKKFVDEMKNHGAEPSQITDVTIDMSPAYISGVLQHFPQAIITFDKFHVVKIFNEVINKVRIRESKINPILRGTKFLWLKNFINLSEKQKKEFKTLSKENTQTARAYKIKITLQDIYNKIYDKETARVALNKLISWAIRSRIDEVKEAGKMLKNHLEGIINYWDSRLTSGSVESINSRIQEARRRAKGFRNISNYISMVYLVAGKLPIETINIENDSQENQKNTI